MLMIATIVVALVVVASVVCSLAYLALVVTGLLVANRRAGALPAAELSEHGRRVDCSVVRERTAARHRHLGVAADR